MNGRDARGRFCPGNGYASAGGRARAERLSPNERAAIAAQGFDALAVLHFDGDKQAAATWLTHHGTWAGLFGTEAARQEWPLPR